MIFSMDYDIGYRQPTNPIQYDLKQGMKYGGMPDSALESKYEETDMGDEEMKYNNYARETIMGWNEVTEPTLESDMPRKSYSSKGYLDLLHSGNRAGEEPAHPEIFLELTDKEPRRTATDPDYRQLTRQWEERMRFKYMYPDADNSITQGNWDARSRSYAGKAIQELMRARMQIFSTSKDGKRNEMRREYEHKSEIGKVEDEKDYGEAVKNDGLNPQRATTVLSNRNLQRTKLYNQFTTDHEFGVSRYGEGRRGNYLTQNKVLRDIASDNRYNDSDMIQMRKALGIVLSKAVQQKKTAEHNIEYNDAVLTQDRSTTKPYRDLSFLIRQIATDQMMNKALKGQTRKLPGLPNWTAHSKNDTEEDANKPAHYYVNGELMYKAVQPGADLRKIANNVITDAEKGQEDKTLVVKSVQERKTYKQADTEVQVDGQSVQTYTYKNKNTPAQAPKVQTQNNDQQMQNSDNTQQRKVNGRNYRNASKKDVQLDTNLLDNTSKERLGMAMGDKMAIRRKIDSDNLRVDEKMENNFN